MQFLTADQINQIKRIIAKRHAAIIFRVVGPEALTPEERSLLEQAGIPLAQQESALRDAYLYGQLLGKLEKPELRAMSYEQFKDAIEKNPIPLTQAEEFAVQAAELHAGAHIRHLGAKVEQQASMLVFKEDAAMRAKLLAEIVPEVKANIEKRESIGKLKKELGWLQKDWSRDWNRVALTEKTNAMQRGVADAMKVKDGDPWVFKRPMPDACKHCVRLFIGPDGHPRIFKLSTLESNGTNVGSKTVDWKPIVGTVHPHCQCQLIRVPEGWGFDENSDLVPGGTFGVRYDADGAVQKAMEAEDTLQKSFRVQERINFQGLPIAIEHAAGSIRPWKDADGTPGETRMLFAYGFIEGTLGPDGDEYDCFVGPDPLADEVYIIHQNDPSTGEWDEDKSMIGFPDAFTAKAAYLIHYDRPEFFGSMSIIPFYEFVQKVMDTTRPGSFQSDGMVKGYNTPSEVYATGSQMGDRAISQSAGGVSIMFGLPMNHAGAQTRAEEIKKIKEHLAKYTDKDRERFMMKIDPSVYKWQDGEPAEAVFPFVHVVPQHEDMDAAVLDDIPRNKFLLEEQIAKRLHQPATNLVIKSAPSGEGPKAGHKFITREWMKDHWVYTYAEHHGGKIEGHEHDEHLVIIKLPKAKKAKLEAFKKEHGLKFPVIEGSKYVMLPIDKDEADKLRSHPTQTVQNAFTPVIPVTLPKPIHAAPLPVLQPSDLKPVPSPPAHVLQRGQSVTVKMKEGIIKGTIVGYDGSDNAVFADQQGKRRLAPWKHVRISGEKQAQVSSYDHLPAGAIRKASPEHAKFVTDALQEALVENGKPTQAYVDWLHEKGVEAFLVGGFCRDLIAGTAHGESPSKIRSNLRDHDVVASANVRMGKAMFEELGHGKLGGWAPYGTVIGYGPHKTDGLDFASMSQGGFFDFDPVPHSDTVVDTPPVTWDQDLQADAKRRDFACNSVYYDTRNQAFIDPTGHGIEDAKNRFLRVTAGAAELKKNKNIALRFWKFRVRGFTSDEVNTSLMRDNFDAHMKAMTSDEIVSELLRAAGKGKNGSDVKVFLQRLKEIMVTDGAGGLYTKHVEKLESKVVHAADHPHK